MNCSPKIFTLTFLTLWLVIGWAGEGDSSRDPWYFLHITDPHCVIAKGCEGDPLESPTLRRWQSLLDQIDAFQPPPRFILCTGDLVNFGAGTKGEENFRAMLSVLYNGQGAQEYFVDEEKTMPIYFCPGNHDGKASNMLPSSFENYYRLVREESYYSVRGEGYAIFSLNSGLDAFNDPHWILSEGDGLYEDDVQRFLEDLSAADDTCCKIVMVHHPFINPEASFVGYPWNDWVDGVFLNFRDEFIQACQDHDVAVVLSGHYDLGRPYRHDGIWDRYGQGWDQGDGTVFVMTNGIQLMNAYRRVSVLPDGTVQVAEVEQFEGPEADGVPTSFKLYQNHPNPFNTRTLISFDLPYSSPVKLEIFNMLGQRIDTLVDGHLAGGQHRVAWSGRDVNDNQVTSGVYFYSLTAGGFRQTGKMIFLK